MQAPVQRSSQGPLPAPGACMGGEEHTAYGTFLGGKALPPSLTLHRETCLDGMAVTTDTQPPTTRRWICATTTQSTGCYLLEPEALCPRGLQASPLGARCHSLHIPKAVALPRVTSRDTRLLVKHRQGHVLTPTLTLSHTLPAAGSSRALAQAQPGLGHWGTHPRLSPAEQKAHRVPGTAGDRATRIWKAPLALGPARKQRVEKGQQ